MSKASKSTKAEKLTYEEAQQQLADLVESMEQGETPLADLVSNFEQGMALLKTCQNHLNTAESKIELIKENNGTIEAGDATL